MRCFRTSHAAERRQNPLFRSRRRQTGHTSLLGGTDGTGVRTPRRHDAGFLILGSVILGERRFVLTAVIAALATGIVWYLVQVVLGIFLRPLPMFMGG